MVRQFWSFLSKNAYRGSLFRAAVTPLIGVLGLVVLKSGLLFDVRLAMSEPALRASASRMTRDHPGQSFRASAWHGWIETTGMREDAGCVIWWVKGGFLDREGLAYASQPRGLAR